MPAALAVTCRRGILSNSSRSHARTLANAPRIRRCSRLMRVMLPTGNFCQLRGRGGWPLGIFHSLIGRREDVRLTGVVLSGHTANQVIALAGNVMPLKRQHLDLALSVRCAVGAMATE